VFRLGFDKCATYANNKADYPVFKVYFKNNRVCYIVLSGAAFGSVRAGYFVTKDNIGFNSKKAEVLKAHGEGYRFLDMANYDGEYIYEKQGISFVVENDEGIISMDIFPAQ
jgi:translation elongation factor P/translation initiation factor 5A